jgi:hypothetical protein
LENAKHLMFSLKMAIFPKSTSWKSYVPIVANCKDFYVSQCLETYEVFFRRIQNSFGLYLRMGCIYSHVPTILRKSLSILFKW